jgi:hypothetical protein
MIKMSLSIFQCDKSRTDNKCDDERRNPPPSCDTIEKVFNSIWDKASPSEQKNLEDLYTKLRTEPEDETRGWCPKDSCTPETIHDACKERTYRIYLAKPEEFIKPRSDCEYIVSNIPPNLPTDWKNTILGKDNGIYDIYTDPVISCRFPDQDYGDDHDTAKSVCLEQAKYTQKHNEAMKKLDNNAWGTARSAGSNAKAINIMNTHLSLSMKPKTLIEQINKCSNITQTSMFNNITSNCPSIYENNDTIKTLIDAGYTPEEIKSLGRSTIKNVTQENTLKTTQGCEMKNMLDSLLSMNASIDNSAMQEALASAEGIGANSESVNNTCTEISTDISPCKYIAQTNCCNNVVNTNLANVITAGCNTDVDNIIQRNSVQNTQSCKIAAQSTISEEMASAIFNVTSQSASSKAVGFGGLGLIIGIIIVLIIVAAGAAYYFSGKIKLIIGVVGGILAMGGISSIVYFFTSFKKAEQLVNDAYSVCDGSFNFQQPERMTFEKANAIFTETSDIKGFDFFPDDTMPGEGDGEARKLDSPSNIPSDWLGLAVFMSDVGRGDSCKAICKDDTVKDYKDCPDDKRIKSLTNVKIRSNMAALWSGFVMLIIGVIMGVIPFFM